MAYKDIQTRRAMQKAYYARKRLEIQTRRAEYFRQYAKTEIGRAGKLLNFYRMVGKYPLKYKARYTLRNAVRLGKIVKGCCEVCGSLEVEAHHDDYSKPFEVRWLCWLHHRELEGRRIPRQGKRS